MNSRMSFALFIAFLLIAGCAQTGATRGEDEGIYLSDLQESQVFNIHGGLGRDVTYWGFPLQVDGVRYTKAVVTHPAESPGFVEYNLGGKYSKLTALIALLDDSGESGAYHGNAVFEVEVDGRKIFRSPVLQWGQRSSQNIEVDIRGAQKMKLWVECANYSNYSDHAAWINAKLVR